MEGLLEETIIIKVDRATKADLLALMRRKRSNMSIYLRGMIEDEIKKSKNGFSTFKHQEDDRKRIG